ncbi:putative protein [Methanobacterium congolense]|uniref:Zinc-ribbon domain-containing protein n=1 Tax=Methanobacterium congolense TaxID=118062 RepID=A0A1D3L321_9EURY|nr:putative protein [Methanobacterium congolense]
MKCIKCGHENDSDAKYCEKCGSTLTITESAKQDNEGMKTSTKLLILVVVVLVAGLGLTSGMLLQMNKGVVAANNTNTVNQSETVTGQATWHQVATYTEPDEGVMNFIIQGQKCKVVMTATPPMDYQQNILGVDLLKDNSALTTGLISWEPTEALTTKEKTIETSAGPGNYQVNIAVTDLQDWQVTVYDYY